MPQPGDQDRDLTIRTILGEADPGTGADSWRAIANVIHNRVVSGNFGNSPSQVVLAKNQFEPWSARPKELLAIDPNSKAYQQVGSVVDDVFFGNSPDPTGGATHFFSPRDQAALGRKPPSWAQGAPLAQIGGHSFYAPEGTVSNSAAGGSSAAPRSLFGSGGFAMPGAHNGAPTATAGPAVTPPATFGPSLFSSGGFTMPQAPPPAAPPQMIGNRVIDPSEVTPGAAPATQPMPPSAPPGTIGATLQDVRSSLDPMAVIPGVLTAGAQGIWGAIKGGALAAQSGLQDIRTGNVWPTMPRLSSNPADARTVTPLIGSSYQVPGLDPQSAQPGGVLKIAGGAAGVLTSPLAGPANALGDFATDVTGNPDFGEKVSALSAPLPLKFLGPTSRTVATARSTNALVNLVGPENVPALVSAARQDPSLRIMDISDAARKRAQGLIIQPDQPEASSILDQSVKDNQANRSNVVNSAFTAEMGPAPNVVQMVDSLKQRAQAVGQQMIQPAIENAGPVDVTDIVKSLDKTIGPYALKQLKAGETPKVPMTDAQQTALDLRQRLRGDIVDGQPDSTPNTTGRMFLDPAQAHEIQSQLRYEASTQMKGLAGSDKLIGGQKMGVRNQLVDAIDKASPQITDSPIDFLEKQPNIPQWALNAPPDAQAIMAKSLGWTPTTTGSYKPALSKYRDAMNVQEAFEDGFNGTTLKNRQGHIEDTPEGFQQIINNSSPEEVVARRLGTRADINRQIKGVKNQGLAGTNITAIEYNRQKLASLFGDDEAGRLSAAMDNARAQAETNSKLVAGSKTAETTAQQQASALPKVGGGNVLNWMGGPALEIAGQYALGPEAMGLGSALYGAGKGLQLGTQAINRASTKASNIALARALSATGGERNQIIGRLAAHPKVVRALQKSSNALTVP